MEDPHAILGVPAGASPSEVTAAYRALAKRMHPDLGDRHGKATAQMAAINVAYELLRDGLPAPISPAPAPRRSPGDWLPSDLRRALGTELLSTLEADESVQLLTQVTTWASPQTLLALTDRRLLWLLDDAVANRVRALRPREVASAVYAMAWPWRRRGVVRVRRLDGRRLVFSHVRPSAAQRIVRTLNPGAAGHAPYP